VTLSNECKGCKKWECEGKTNTREFLSWFVEHDKVFTLNHEGSAKTMEAQGIRIKFSCATTVTTNPLKSWNINHSGKSILWLIM
jgi:hypothetical protein